jgi:hypothetical protein
MHHFRESLSERDPAGIAHSHILCRAIGRVSIRRLLRAVLSCEELELNPPLVLYEGWEGVKEVVADAWDGICWRLVLDAIVKHLKKYVVFILLGRVSLNVS